MEIGKYYRIMILDFDKIQIIPKGKRPREYKYDDFYQEKTDCWVDMHGKRYYFTYNDRTAMYFLIAIESTRKIKKMEEEERDNMPTSVVVEEKKRPEEGGNRSNFKRTERITKYFEDHPDELKAVKKFCRIEGVHKFENLRYEIRRMMGIGEIYHLTRDELTTILKKFGFKVAA